MFAEMACFGIKQSSSLRPLLSGLPQGSQPESETRRFLVLQAV